MFQIAIAIGWAVLLILLLYIWADIREIAGSVRENRRELLRSSFGGRTAGRAPAVQEETKDTKTMRQGEEGAPLKSHGQTPLKASEEQVLKEVLTEFLG